MATLVEITNYITIVAFFIILILGTIGDILNALTFLSKDFRKKSCIFYMIWSSLLDLFFLDLGIIIRLSAAFSGNNLINTNYFVCKVRAYLLICLPAMASTCLFLSTFDRCLSTSINPIWRQLSSISFAKRLLIITMLFLLISSSFCLIVYDIYNGQCTTVPGVKTMAVVVYGNVFISAIPHGGILICGILTWIHLRQLRNRINQESDSNNLAPFLQRMNRELFKLIFVQAFLALVLELQRDISATYSLITSSVNKSLERQQLEYFFIQLSIVLYYIKYGMAFYVNYACSSVFRKTFQEFMKSLMNRCFHLCRRD